MTAPLAVCAGGGGDCCGDVLVTSLRYMCGPCRVAGPLPKAAETTPTVTLTSALFLQGVGLPLISFSSFPGQGYPGSIDPRQQHSLHYNVKCLMIPCNLVCHTPLPAT